MTTERDVHDDAALAATGCAIGISSLLAFEGTWALVPVRAMLAGCRGFRSGRGAHCFGADLRSVNGGSCSGRGCGVILSPTPRVVRRASIPL